MGKESLTMINTSKEKQSWNVCFWNKYNPQVIADPIIKGHYRTNTLTEAFDIAQKDSRIYNNQNKLEINFITCNGFIRAV